LRSLDVPRREARGHLAENLAREAAEGWHRGCSAEGRRCVMSHASVRYVLSAAVAGPLMAVLLGGCIYHEKTTEKTVPAATPVVVAPSGERVVNYPDGRYQLYGDGKVVPYYWVWIPSGTTPPVPPAPPRLP